MKSSEIFKNDEQIISALKNINVPKENSNDFWIAIQNYKGYECIHSFAKQVQAGKTLSDKQMTQAKRLAAEIKKAYDWNMKNKSRQKTESFVLDESLFKEEDLPDAKLDKPIEVSTEPDKDVILSGNADILMDLIKDEYEAIQGYNSFLAGLDVSDELNEMRVTIEHIRNEEQKHIGELTVLLTMISPDTNEQEKGKEEAKDELDMNEPTDDEPEEEGE